VVDDVRDFLGAGWAAPMGVNGRGGIALASGEAAIARSIELILSTAKGERRMRPHFGCGIHDLVFAPNDPTTHGLIQSQVRDALAWWEPRIEVIGVEVVAHPEDEAALLIDINYRIKTTSAERSLVYPFYVIPGEE
jgi:phage baseplate assembly protein W